MEMRESDGAEAEAVRGAYEDGCKDGYTQGVIDTACHATKERAILTDLIAELRTVNSEANLPPFDDMADRAEARLREVTGDE